MKKMVEKMFRIWFAIKLIVKMSYQVAWAKQNFIKYLPYTAMFMSFLGQPSKVEKLIAEELDKLAKEAGVMVGLCTAQGEEEVMFHNAIKGVASTSAMAALPKEVMKTNMDTIVIYLDALARDISGFDVDHDVELTVRRLVRHEFQHILQFIELRKMGYDIVSILQERNKKEFGAIDYVCDVFEYDAYQAQYVKQRPIQEFIHDFETEYGAA